MGREGQQVSNPELRCPKCGQSEKFHVFATVFVTVDGDAELLTDDEVGSADIEYDKYSDTVCPKCDHSGEMWEFMDCATNFYKEESENE